LEPVTALLQVNQFTIIEMFLILQLGITAIAMLALSLRSTDVSPLPSTDTLQRHDFPHSRVKLPADHPMADAVSVSGTRKRSGIASLSSFHDDEYLLTNITLGRDQTFGLIVDTDSSDTWVVGNGFQCVNASTGTNIGQPACEIWPFYTPSISFEQIPGRTSA
jgi:Eukaryotic aspartyl protease